MNSHNSPSTKPLFRGIQVVSYLLYILEALLAFRFVLKFMGANAAAGFTNFIYAITWPFTAPFLAVFQQTTIEGSIFEWTTLLAMLVYWMVGLAIVKLFSMSKTVSTSEAATKLDQDD